MSEQVELIRGRRYRVHFRPADQPRKKVRIIEGKYLGWSKFYTKHEFDLRPDHGTTNISGEDIVKIEEVQ